MNHLPPSKAIPSLFQQLSDPESTYIASESGFISLCGTKYSEMCDSF